MLFPLIFVLAVIKHHMRYAYFSFGKEHIGLQLKGHAQGSALSMGLCKLYLTFCEWQGRLPRQIHMMGNGIIIILYFFYLRYVDNLVVSILSKRATLPQALSPPESLAILAQRALQPIMDTTYTGGIKMEMVQTHGYEERGGPTCLGLHIALTPPPNAHLCWSPHTRPRAFFHCSAHSPQHIEKGLVLGLLSRAAQNSDGPQSAFVAATSALTVCLRDSEFPPGRIEEYVRIWIQKHSAHSICRPLQWWLKNHQ